MDYENEVYIIPANVTDNGNVFNGNVKKKCAYEAGIIGLIGAIFSFLLLGFLSLITKIVIMSVFVIIGFVALFGIKGDSLIEVLLEVFFFKRKKRTMKYRLPRKDSEVKEKKLFKRKEKEI